VEAGDFVTRFTHDLRTPLAAMRGALFLLKRHGADLKGPREQKWIRGMDRSAEDLDHLIGQVDAIVRIGRAVSSRVSTDLHDLLVLAIARVRDDVPGCRIDLEWPAATATTGLAQPSVLSAAFHELLRNAVASSPEGGGTVVEVAADADRLEVRVKDHGPGVPAEERTRLFTPFHHVGSSASKGAGLGLCIAQLAVQVAGGRIDYSREGGESVFTVRLSSRSATPGVARAAVMKS
jgi:two-component system sensor histidine kinase KdpD